MEERRTFWIATDKSGYQGIYSEKPKRSAGRWLTTHPVGVSILPSKVWPKWEDEPAEYTAISVSELEQLRAELAEAKAQIASFRTANFNLVSELDDATAKAEKAEAELAQAKAEIDFSESRYLRLCNLLGVDYACEEPETVEQAVVRMKGELAALKEELIDCLAKHSYQKRSRTEAVQRAENTEIELAALKARIAGATRLSISFSGSPVEYVSLKIPKEYCGKGKHLFALVPLDPEEETP
jgi:multidrug resistance efflux pump